MRRFGAFLLRHTPGMLVVFAVGSAIVLASAQFPEPAPKPTGTFIRKKQSRDVPKPPEPRLVPPDSARRAERPERPTREPTPPKELPYAAGVRGQYHIGGGIVVRASLDPAQQLTLSLFRDRMWQQERQSDFNNWRFRSRPELLGEKRTIDPGVGTTRTGPLVWDLGWGELVHIHVGTREADQFTRSNQASHCAIFTMGGDDTLTREPGRAEHLTSFDIMVAQDGTPATLGPRTSSPHLGEWASPPTSSFFGSAGTPARSCHSELARNPSSPSSFRGFRSLPCDPWHFNSSFDHSSIRWIRVPELIQLYSLVDGDIDPPRSCL